MGLRKSSSRPRPATSDPVAALTARRLSPPVVALTAADGSPDLRACVDAVAGLPPALEAERWAAGDLERATLVRRARATVTAATYRAAERAAIPF